MVTSALRPTGRGADRKRPRVLRGGAWNNNRQNVRCAYRNRNNPNNRNDNNGFRVVARPAPWLSCSNGPCTRPAGRKCGAASTPYVIASKPGTAVARFDLQGHHGYRWQLQPCTAISSHHSVE